jgi:phosphatidylethanolamine-binding protein (PEBP) family uncharacterized protein
MVWPGVALAVGVAVIASGCGGTNGSSRTPTSAQASAPLGASTATSPQTAPQPELRQLAVSIPVVGANHLLPKRYTCDGADISPAVRWGRLPPGTVEVAVFVIDVSLNDGRYFFDWALTGLKPGQHEVSVGKLPAGALVGRNSFGSVNYSMCVPKGHYEENAIVNVFALAHPLAARRGFDPEAVWNEAKRSPAASGTAGWRYDRRAS